MSNPTPSLQSEPEENFSMHVYENLIGWLANQLALFYAEKRLDGIPAMLEDAEPMLPDREFKLLEGLVGF